MKSHNWFSIDGHIRVNDPITATRLLNILHEQGIEFFGGIVISDTKDEDYNEKK